MTTFPPRLVGKADNYACQQELPAYQHQFRILEDLLMHQEGPTFSYFHLNEYTHNELAMARHYDLPLEQLVTKLSKAGALNDTFFLLLADHGFQRGDNPFVLTEQVVKDLETNLKSFISRLWILWKCITSSYNTFLFSNSEIRIKIISTFTQPPGN